MIIWFWPFWSIESSDPFDFPTMENSYSAESDDALSDCYDDSMEYDDDEDSNTTLPKYTKSRLVNSTKDHHRNDSLDSLHELYKKERKKSKLESSSTREYSVEENKKGVLGITMKINAKDGSAKTYVKQSPLHQSVPEYEIIGSNKKWKDSSRSRNSLADRMSDSSMDGDVFITMATDGSSKHMSPSGSGSSSVLYNSQNSTVSPRILTSKKHGLEHGASATTGPFVTKDKKKKSSKLSGESKHEKKRRRAADAIEKDQLIKKQKVYDFDFNESEHLPPTKIKIRTADGKVQIQTDSKTYSMSPLPMKPDSGSQANSGSSSKRHKSEKSVKHKKDKSDKYRSKSEAQGMPIVLCSGVRVINAAQNLKHKVWHNANCMGL